MCFRVLHIIILLYVSFKVSRTLEWRVFDGQELRYDVHSYLVKLQFFRYNITNIGTCSGSVISNTWIITSAHCMQSKLHTIIVLHKSEYNMRIIAEVRKHDVYSHPDFIPNVDTMSNREKDIALLFVRRKIEFNWHIKPIKLSLIRPRIGDTGIIAGFGESEVYLTAPREGIVIIESCPEKSRERTKNICTIGSVRPGSGDSGGPLIYKGKLAGLTSGGCVNVRKNNMCLTVYASVERNIGWISAIVSSV